MSAFAHGRNMSEDTTSSAASYHIILDHLMSYPGTYDIPLRTMYTLNCSPRAQPFPRSSTPSSNNSSPTTAQFPPAVETQQAVIQFTHSLLAQINQLPSQPASLPPSFVTSFVRRCFTPQLELVDFPQALTALDYLKDLEMRRRRDMADTLDKLAIDKSTLRPTPVTNQWCERDARIVEWVPTLVTKDRKIDALYTQCYIGLRRWILVNEMSLTPFNKQNCIAMLNTLYPPMLEQQPMPTKKLTDSMLRSQREGFFKYIRTVEKRGTSVLENLMIHGKRDTDATGWPNVSRALIQYLNLANSIINECQDINIIIAALPKPPELAQPAPSTPATESEKRKGRKIDSGVSFNSDGRHNKTPSTSSAKSAATHASAQVGKSGSTLERITRELRRIRSKQRLEVTELVKPYAADDIEKENRPSTPKHRGFSGLRKMRSLGALGDLKQNNASSTSFKGATPPAGTDHVPAFDPEEMRKQREAFEKRTGRPHLS